MLSKFQSIRRLNQIPKRCFINSIESRLNRSTSSSKSGFNLVYLLAACILVTGSTSLATCDQDPVCGVEYESGHSMLNWSGTHSWAPYRIYQPRNAQEVVRVLQQFHKNKQSIRPVGTALSPNGISMVASKPQASALQLHHLDRIEVNPETLEVTIGAGATVNAVLTELKKYNLTLSNFSSIQEQQMGGWCQVSAHGTGRTLSTVDDMIVRMQVATPTHGLMTLSKSANPDMFAMCKVGLGALGVVTELTLQCMPSMNLLEHTKVYGRKDISSGHARRLVENRHVRYMWIPYSNTVVSVTSNPTDHVGLLGTSAKSPAAPTRQLALLAHELRLLPDKTVSQLEGLSFSQLRDILLDHAPLDPAHIKKVNQAEAASWLASEGSRCDDSTNILGFDCGGQQLVFEVCFPIGAITPDSTNTRDISFMQKLLAIVEDAGIAAPSPLEQRWTARSSAPMSPAYSVNKEEVFCWVGVIMYLPPHQSETQRQEITRAFDRYCRAMEPLLEEYDAHAHWAKIEIPGRGISSTSADSIQDNVSRMKVLRRRIAQKYPVQEFHSLRQAIDPNNILGNALVDALLVPENNH